MYVVAYFSRTKHNIPLVRESLQMDDQIVWCFINLHLFEGCNVIFTLAAVPLVVAGKGLFH